MSAIETAIVRGGSRSGLGSSSANDFATSASPAGSHGLNVLAMEAIDRTMSPRNPIAAAPSGERTAADPRNDDRDVDHRRQPDDDAHLDPRADRQRLEEQGRVTARRTAPRPRVASAKIIASDTILAARNAVRLTGLASTSAAVPRSFSPATMPIVGRNSGEGAELDEVLEQLVDHVGDAHLGQADLEVLGSERPDDLGEVPRDDGRQEPKDRKRATTIPIR